MQSFDINCPMDFYKFNTGQPNKPPSKYLTLLCQRLKVEKKLWGIHKTRDDFLDTVSSCKWLSVYSVQEWPWRSSTHGGHQTSILSSPCCRMLMLGGLTGPNYPSLKHCSSLHITETLLLCWAASHRNLAFSLVQSPLRLMSILRSRPSSQSTTFILPHRCSDQRKYVSLHHMGVSTRQICFFVFHWCIHIGLYWLCLREVYVFIDFFVIIYSTKIPSIFVSHRVHLVSGF